MPHTWYLAADSQVFIYALFFIMLIWKVPRYKGIIMFVGVAITMIVPVIVIYSKGYSGIYMASPEYVHCSE